ncbi:C40 family peptidase [Mycolicibacterium arenosum]|uniref:NlpC/P60 family protein n=1 Tax=Mycolicibacterium arenosum TaxID=2952157 RepID=A0ABT1M319_9MYCO|nr:C40 family peptidase [Mycolicibacterium sp. CAU 1645]MCP9273551.1 NlpC/P60 family protein [Mycolicibacterium sp. CAU 1645]
MPSALTAALSARIREIADTVGPGWPAGEGPIAVLDDAGARLADLSAQTTAAWRATKSTWSGQAADRAGAVTAQTVAAIDDLAADLDRMRTATVRAGEAVAQARARLEAIAAEFEQRAAALEAALDEPEAERAVAAEGRRAIDEANAVVDELKAELDGQAAAVQSPAVTIPQSSAPGGFSPPAMPGVGSGSGGGGTPMQAGWSGLGDGVFGEAVGRGGATPEAGDFGSGVSVALPDGTTSTAPNAVAASAVRHALTQLGVPYDWGGTTPGVGLDCSGLTQWAYHQAGLDLPRLAQEQDVGTAISQGSLRPGDLAVWDGHVAMVVGNGMMIEAGDPVQLSPIRTTNAGQGFQGFWRPTA